MPQVGPLTIFAHNRDQAVYLVRSRAQQRGVDIQELEVEAAGQGAWSVIVTVADANAARAASAALDEDTQVLHLRSHPHR